ncbi:hypothetical protein NMG60_11022329 [Bertholletia excelsa]
MSLRYMSRVVCQAAARAGQGMKDQGSKCDSTLRSIKDSASSSKQARRLSGGVDSPAFKGSKNDRLKQAEESLRTIMYLSCWGPN